MGLNTHDRNSEHAPSAKQRMALFDVVRGFSVLSMVLFHLCYDLRFLYGVPLEFFRPPYQDVWRASISWTFLLVAGCMCTFSRDNLKRSLRYLAVALAVYVVTTLVAVDTPISFGIIFCMGGSTLIYAALERLGVQPKGILAALVFALLFLVARGVPRGHIGIGSFVIELPRWLYAAEVFSFLGLPGPHFASGDYYPLIPFTLMYLAGASLGNHWREHGYPDWFSTVSCGPLEAVGRLALPIYVVHQPLILAVLQLVF